MLLNPYLSVYKWPEAVYKWAARNPARITWCVRPESACCTCTRGVSRIGCTGAGAAIVNAASNVFKLTNQLRLLHASGCSSLKWQPATT